VFERIANFQALCAAAQQAAKGKRRKTGAAAFLANLEKNVLRLERELQDGTWHPGAYTVIEVHDPKPRRVSAAPFRDRVIHHALCTVIEPVLSRGFIHDSYANRLGKGTHRAIARYEKYRDRYQWCLRCDIFRYFPSIDHAILKEDLRRRVHCSRTLSLLDAIVHGSNPQEPVHLYYPGDDLFTPFERRRGLPIGNLTSQLFGNLYLDRLDHYIKEVLRVPGYVRYVDDFALFGNDPREIQVWRRELERFLARRRLTLHPLKTRLIQRQEPTEFLGFILFPGGWRRLPDENVRRFRNRLRGMRDRYRVGTITCDDVVARVNGWVGHALHADTWRLRRNIFCGGWFDPLLKPDGFSRVVRGGGWNNKPQNVRSANRNRNAPTNLNNNLGFRVASTLYSTGASTAKAVPGASLSVQSPS
jgi:retron-type reverse transcriptase